VNCTSLNNNNNPESKRSCVPFAANLLWAHMSLPRMNMVANIVCSRSFHVVQMIMIMDIVDRVELRLVDW
jgi:hypothetical protein